MQLEQAEFPQDCSSGHSNSTSNNVQQYIGSAKHEKRDECADE